jgi:hypothetical protein
MFNFYEMIRRVAAGGQCFREAWGGGGHMVGLFSIDPGAEERLALFKPETGPDGTWYPWTVSRSDIDAIDWRPVEKKPVSGGLRVAASPVPGKTTVQ